MGTHGGLDLEDDKPVLSLLKGAVPGIHHPENHPSHPGGGPVKGE